MIKNSSKKIKSVLFHLKEALLSRYPLRIYLLQNIVRKFKLGSFKYRLEIDAFLHPGYAYGMYCASLQAKRLGLKKISLIEFGVGAGHGILEIESYAADIEREVGVQIDIYGFDSGVGLPDSRDYKDQIYYWAPGDFKQDIDSLSRKLVKSKIIYGEIEQTISTFFENFKPAPIGFISFDLDYYTSTKSALKLLEENNYFFLPRVECYVDDINSSELLCASSEAGVLRAIYEYNETSVNKLLIKEGVHAFRRYPSSWNHSAYVFHRFDHASYNNKLTP
jgi:hypothetical protein